MSNDSPLRDPHLEADRCSYTAPLPGTEMERLFAEIAVVTVDAQPSMLDRLQQRSTTARVLMSVALGVVLSGVLIAAHGLRTDLSGDAGLRMLVALLGLAALGISAVMLSLRGLHKRSLGWTSWLLIGIMLLAPAGLSSLPEFWPGQTSSARPMPWESGCFWFGGTVASLTGAGVVLLQRSRHMAVWRVLSAAAAGGCAGFITQQFFCPSGDTWHILTTHGLLGLVVSALLLLVSIPLRLRARMRA